MVPLAPLNIAEPPPSAPTSDEHSIGHTSEGPSPSQEIASNEEYPAVIELRNGSVYTARSYWVSGKTFHFVTTRFDHFQVPLALLEHLSPRQPSQTSDATVTAPPRALSQRTEREARK